METGDSILDAALLSGNELEWELYYPEWRRNFKCPILEYKSPAYRICLCFITGIEGQSIKYILVHASWIDLNPWSVMV